MKSLRYYLLVMPALLLSLSIIAIPGLLTVYVSFTDWNGVSPDMKWIGLRTTGAFSTTRCSGRR